MKSNFIKSTIILIIGGVINKILAMFIKIILTRTIKETGLSIYMLILPTFNLFITLATLSLATSISKLISEKRNSKKVILSITPICLIYNLILMGIVIILAPYISNNLLHNKDTYYPIMGISFTLPFICISTILKGYFYGKEKMMPYVISNVIEQIVRLFIIILIIPKLIRYGTNISVLGVILINIISEISSIIILILFIPNKKINIKYFKFDNMIFKDIMNISLSTTGSRLIGSISYFLEPIILTLGMNLAGYSNSYTVMEYGIITGYVYPLLLIPSFFTMAISTSLLPIVSSNYAKGNYNYAKKKLYQAISLSLMIGIFFTGVFLLFPKTLLNVIYNTDKGINYIKVVAPFFLLHYIQGPLTSYLQGIGYANKAMMGTLIGAIIKNILLFILTIFMGIWGFIISTIANIFYVTIQHIYCMNKRRIT